MKLALMHLATLALVAFVVACGGDGGTTDPTYSCAASNPTGTCATGQSCLEGACVATTALCSAANPTGSCTSGSSCVSGTCTLNAALCSATNLTGACVTGQTCVAGACTAVCSAASPAGYCPTGYVCVAGACAVTSNECDKTNNAGKRQALTAAQPAIGVRSKTTLAVDKSWTSLDGDATVTCEVTLQFKDSNGNGTLDPYEDWTLTADERATDLLARLSATEKAALMAHATVTDVPSSSNTAPSTALQAMVAAGIRFGRTSANTAQPLHRATWANSVQEACEATALGVPFMLSSEPLHTSGGGRTKSKGFIQWPAEQGLGATATAAIVEAFGGYAAKDYRAIGVRLALSPSADLATDARWFNGQFSFGEDSATVAAMAAAYVHGMQGASLSPTSVACVLESFPGAGAAKTGWDARLAKGKYLTYPGNALDAHLAAFEPSLSAGVAGVMPAYGVLQTGTYTALAGLINGQTIEQVGASFSHTLLTDVLRTHYGYDGLVLSPWGVLEDAAVSPLGAPWGHEGSTRAQRVAAAVNAGVDQFGGLGDVTPVTDARTAGSITDAQIGTAAGRALVMMFQLGLFENPYVDPLKAAGAVATDAEYQASLNAFNKSQVLLVNANKPAGFLNGAGDGTQTGDKGNAGNGTGKVLPAPPGAPYIAAGCAYYVAGNFDLDYVRSVSAGYGELTNDETVVYGYPTPTPEERAARADYVFIRVSSPFVADPDGGALNLPQESLTWSGNGLTGAADFAELAWARAAINAVTGSKTQIVVAIDAGRLPVLDEILSYGVSGVYVDWLPLGNPQIADKVFLDVAFGIVNGAGTLPVGLPASDAAVQAAKEDLAGDGESTTYVRGFGLQTTAF